MGLVPHAKRGRFEQNMVDGVIAFQKQANITQNGSIGKRTYALLFRHIDAFGRSQLMSFARRQKIRDKMVAEQRWAIANSDQIHYPLHDIRKAGETATAVEKWQTTSFRSRSTARSSRRASLPGRTLPIRPGRRLATTASQHRHDARPLP